MMTANQKPVPRPEYGVAAAGSGLVLSGRRVPLFLCVRRGLRIVPCMRTFRLVCLFGAAAVAVVLFAAACSGDDPPAATVAPVVATAAPTTVPPTTASTSTAAGVPELVDESVAFSAYPIVQAWVDSAWAAPASDPFGYDYSLWVDELAAPSADVDGLRSGPLTISSAEVAEQDLSDPFLEKMSADLCSRCWLEAALADMTRDDRRNLVGSSPAHAEPGILPPSGYLSTSVARTLEWVTYGVYISGLSACSANPRIVGIACPVNPSTLLNGPCWTSVGRMQLSRFQHERIRTVQRMSCEMYNALLEAWRNQWRWHQRGHAYDDVHITDMYDDGRIAGSRFTLYKQFTEHRQLEQAGAGRDGVSWTDVALQIGRGVINRFDTARESFYDRCAAKKAGVNIAAGYPRFKPHQRWNTIVVPDAKPAMTSPVTGLGGGCRSKASASSNSCRTTLTGSQPNSMLVAEPPRSGS